MSEENNIPLKYDTEPNEQELKYYKDVEALYSGLANDRVIL